MINGCQQRLEEAGDVEKDDGLGVDAQDLADEDFEEFFERAEAAGQDEEGIAAGFELGFCQRMSSVTMSS